jgi:hypothetical protein
MFWYDGNCVSRSRWRRGGLRARDESSAALIPHQTPTDRAAQVTLFSPSLARPEYTTTFVGPCNKSWTRAREEVTRLRVTHRLNLCLVGVRGNDANRALVWWIRFEAFRNWCDRTDVMTRSTAQASIVRDACEAAASFPLNHLWEFDTMDFARAVEGMAVRRGSQRSIDDVAAT